MYLMGFMGLGMYCEVCHVALFQGQLPFLPLMLTSLYCSLGVFYVWAKYCWWWCTLTAGDLPETGDRPGAGGQPDAGDRPDESVAVTNGGPCAMQRQSTWEQYGRRMHAQAAAHGYT